MAKLFYVGVVVALALGLVAPHAWASVPDPAYCTTWQNIPGTGTIMFCPAGDGSYLDITVKDQFNMPMGGVLVDVHLSGLDIIDCPDLACCYPLPTWLPDTTFTTDANGHIPAVYFPCGRHQPGDDTTCCVIESRITCFGVTLFDETLDLTTVDLSQSSPLYVEGLDYSIFSLDWLKNRCRSDYNGDGVVEGLDFSIFANHWLHVCP